MNLKILIVIISFLLIQSCKDNKPNSNSNLIEKREGLIYKQRSNVPYTGLIKDTVNNKIVEYDVKDGLMHGQFKISSIKNMVEMSGTMVKGKNEGEWSYFYPDGKLESKGNFVNDSPEGKWIFYYPSGTKKEEGEYIKGKREGKWIEYDSTGKFLEYKNFSMDKEIN